MEQHLQNPVSGHPKSQITSTIFQEVESEWGIRHIMDPYEASKDISLFSSSLPVIPHKKCGSEDTLGDIINSLTESMLPGDEDDLLAGINDDFDLADLPTQLEDLEDDLFESGGGMEMDDGIRFGHSNLSMSDGVPFIGGNRHELPHTGNNVVVGEHPYGEHPSRTLFVRNINSNVEDSELKSLFEEYGEIRNLYTACKHRGFVMISYYDIRHARIAMRELQNKPLRRRKLDIHFSIPKDNPSEKDINQGTLVVFNLDSSISSDDLRHIFSPYGEVKEIRETPNKRHHKFIEFYDVRAAEVALKALNGSEIAGKRIKLEHSRPGGTRRSMMQQLSQELEQDEARSFWHHVGSPIINSPPGSWSSGFGTISPANTATPLHGLASILPPPHILSNPMKISPIGKDQQGNMTSSFHDSKFDPSSIGTLSGPEFLWGSPTTQTSSWRASPVAPTFLGPPHHHVGSAPPGVHLDRSSSERAFVSPMMYNNGSFGKGQMLFNSGSYQGRIGLNDGLMVGNRSRRVDYSVNQIGNKQYQLDLDKIVSGEDTRTTLMIKNIPNKYTSKMLLAAIDETHTGTYDFVYLPIDFKNKCNVGYAFINMISPSHIISFFEAFNGKKWEKFNSEKVANLAYARIQGKIALITHFQNSSLMNEDKWCRPILFQSEAQNTDDNQDSIPYHNMNICIRQPDGSYSVDSLDGSGSSPEENKYAF
ncbi:hypothetical protein LXL04_022408 [Taraxacum kok-saghyz]